MICHIVRVYCVESIMISQPNTKQASVDDHIMSFLKHAPEKPGCKRYKVQQHVLNANSTKICSVNNCFRFPTAIVCIWCCTACTCQQLVNSVIRWVILLFNALCITQLRKLISTYMASMCVIWLTSREQFSVVLHWLVVSFHSLNSAVAI